MQGDGGGGRASRGGQGDSGNHQWAAEEQVCYGGPHTVACLHVYSCRVGYGNAGLATVLCYINCCIIAHAPLYLLRHMHG